MQCHACSIIYIRSITVEGELAGLLKLECIFFPTVLGIVTDHSTGNVVYTDFSRCKVFRMALRICNYAVKPIIAVLCNSDRAAMKPKLPDRRIAKDVGGKVGSCNSLIFPLCILPHERPLNGTGFHILVFQHRADRQRIIHIGKVPHGIADAGAPVDLKIHLGR